MGLAINELVRKGEISAPIAIGRDHLDNGLGASPYPRDGRRSGRLGRGGRLAGARTRC